jgi:DNA-directed RNA polymerase beta subunit
MSAMTTGNWGGTRIGVTQVRKVLNFIDSISLLRRTTLPSQKKTTATRMRQLTGSVFGCVSSGDAASRRHRSRT